MVLPLNLIVDCEREFNISLFIEEMMQ